MWKPKVPYNGIGLVKIMGRLSGYITATAALAQGDANFVLIPEVPFDLDGEKGFLKALEKQNESKGTCGHSGGGRCGAGI